MMNGYERNAVTYKIVPFPGRVEAFEEKGGLTGRMRLKIVALSPVFVGSGYEDSSGGKLFRSFERSGKKPVLPGSSLKGTFRTISEAVSYSCVSIEKRNRDRLPFTVPYNCRCICCKTYGRMSLKGSIGISDFVLASGETELICVPKMMAPDPLRKNYLDNDGKFRGIKFYSNIDYRSVVNTEIPVEAVCEGGVFDGEVIFHDLHRTQLELLCYSMGLDGSFRPKIGGNKPNGFGRCEVVVKEAVLRGNTGVSAFDPAEYAGNYAGSDDRIKANKKLLTEILE